MTTISDEPLINQSDTRKTCRIIGQYNESILVTVVITYLGAVLPVIKMLCVYLCRAFRDP